MTDWPHLSRAPITEALIDIRVRLADGTSTETLESLHGEIDAQYPHKEPRESWRGQIQFRPGQEPSVETPTGGPDGFFFRSKERNQVVQARMDGFTFSRLRPYESWEELRNEARRLWQLYERIARPDVITRCAVRFINRFDLTPPIEDLCKWFYTYPKIPGSMPPKLDGLFFRLVFPFPQDRVRAILTLAIEQGEDESSLPVILDIDVFRSEEVSCSAADLWERFERLRDIKNQIFFASITPLTRALLQ